MISQRDLEGGFRVLRFAARQAPEPRVPPLVFEIRARPEPRCLECGLLSDYVYSNGGRCYRCHLERLHAQNERHSRRVGEVLTRLEHLEVGKTREIQYRPDQLALFGYTKPEAGETVAYLRVVLRDATFQLFVRRQGGRCPCGGSASELDHDHDTGLVRAALCHPCNVRAGP